MSADLCFQNFAAELRELPAMYGPPSGCLLLAGRDDEWVGCCGLRRFSDEVCEMKRLYVRPSARGAALGRRLIERLLTAARSRGYRRMVLDTLEDMIPAQALYRSFGFRPTKPYYFNPIRGASYMELDLGTAEYRASLMNRNAAWFGSGCILAWAGAGSAAATPPLRRQPPSQASRSRKSWRIPIGSGPPSRMSTGPRTLVRSITPLKRRGSSDCRSASHRHRRRQRSHRRPQGHVGRGRAAGIRWRRQACCFCPKWRHLRARHCRRAVAPDNPHAANRNGSAVLGRRPAAEFPRRQ